MPGETKIRYAGAVYGYEEINAIIDSALNGWFGLGNYAREFEKGLAHFIGCKETILANSGSSASLLAITSLTSWQLVDRLKPNDEVITPACTFPTMFNPIIQNNLKPVVLDIIPETYNIDAENLSEAITNKTRLIVLPHTLGNPNDMDTVMKIAKEHEIWVIEDNSKIIKSFRDWGRACYCESTEKNPFGACGMRFNWKLEGKGNLTYDHKYMYNHIGYNLKPTEIQVAMGVHQLKRLPDFIKIRKRNFKILFEELSILDKYFIFPESHKKADPSWFAFPLTIRDVKKMDRRELCLFLEAQNIETRYIFSGNILRHPAYKNIKTKIIGNLKNSDRVLMNSFFVGIYPGNSEEQTKFNSGSLHLKDIQMSV
ncbi:MAG: aminotransferase class I/II-fold pyridoxal phosphate-dependent enzyme [Candidatus Diapherotrites archaeon]|nr:aminotransferase class I/II-fold pyridoxal phosphate-dependent enzyme [Candidatus Diapherotrites archaeon]